MCQESLGDPVHPIRYVLGVLVFALLGHAVVAAPVADAEPKAQPADAFDFNGDGFADLAAADPSHAITIVFGSKRGLSAAHTQKVTRQSAGLAGRVTAFSGLGQSITSADFDADSYADLATSAGRQIIVIYGGLDGLTARTNVIQKRYLELDEAEDSPPMATGDFDDDGNVDLVVSAPGGEDSSGSVAVFRGSKNGLHADQATKISRDSGGVPGKGFPEDGFGSAVAVGDVTGDGRDDLLITSPAAVSGQFAERESGGAIYLFPGSPAGIRARDNSVMKADAVLEGRDWFSVDAGTRLAVGDLDGDRTADLAVGGSDRCSENYPEIACELVVVFRGGAAGLRPKDHLTWSRQSLGSVAGSGDGAFGSTLAVGDLDSDGHPDLVVGAPYEQVGPDLDAGAVYVIYGTRTGLNSARVQMWTQGHRGIKSVARSEELFGGGYFRILDFGKGRDRDLSVHTPDDNYIQAKNKKPAQGTVNVLYTDRRPSQRNRPTVVSGVSRARQPRQSNPRFQRRVLLTQRHRNCYERASIGGSGCRWTVSRRILG